MPERSDAVKTVSIGVSCYDRMALLERTLMPESRLRRGSRTSAR